MPIDTIIEVYSALPPEVCYRKIMVENHALDESVLKILGDVEVQQYQRI